MNIDVLKTDWLTQTRTESIFFKLWLHNSTALLFPLQRIALLSAAKTAGLTAAMEAPPTVAPTMPTLETFFRE